MSAGREHIKRAIGALYSGAAERLYEPIVIKRAFPLFGGDLNDHVVHQGADAVRAANGRPILDMPVGTGFFTVQLADGHPGLVVGADLAWGMVHETARAALAKGASNITPVQADAHRLPFGTESFGAVLCNNGLQVIPGLRPALRELARVLVEGGTLYVSVVGLPVGGLWPGMSEHLPTVLRPGKDVADEIERTGLRVASMRRHRLAFLIEAIKGPRA